MILAQRITLAWYKDCRGGPGAVRRSTFPQAARLPQRFFEPAPSGVPVHWVRIEQTPNGFHTLIDRREMRAWEKSGGFRLDPMQIIPKEGERCEVRYRYDWHGGAKPERHKYDPASSRSVPLNELAMELSPGDYGRAVCNGRFVDWDTGAWWYEQSVINVLLLPDQAAPLNCFLKGSPTHCYSQTAQLW